MMAEHAASRFEWTHGVRYTDVVIFAGLDYFLFPLSCVSLTSLFRLSIPCLLSPAPSPRGISLSALPSQFSPGFSFPLSKRQISRRPLFPALPGESHNICDSASKDKKGGEG